MRMREVREDRAFAAKPLLADTSHQREVEQLDGDLPFEAAVAALGEPHAAHAALADQRCQTVSADGLASQRLRQRRTRRQRHRLLEKARLVDAVVLGEERLKIYRQTRVASKNRGEP